MQKSNQHKNDTATKASAKNSATTELSVMDKWREIQSEIVKTWEKVSGEDLEQTKGDIAAIVALIAQEYDLKKEEITTRLGELSEHVRATALGEKVEHKTKH